MRVKAFTLVGGVTCRASFAGGLWNKRKGDERRDEVGSLFGSCRRRLSPGVDKVLRMLDQSDMIGFPDFVRVVLIQFGWQGL